MNRIRLMKRFVAGIAAVAALAVTVPVLAAPKSVILATTTSTQDSGLLDILVPIFEKESGYLVKTIAVGIGIIGVGAIHFFFFIGEAILVTIQKDTA